MNRLSMRCRPCDIGEELKYSGIHQLNEEAVVNQRNPHFGSAFQAIRAIDYTVVFCARHGGDAPLL